MERVDPIFEDNDLSGLPTSNPGSGKPWRDPTTGALIVGVLGTFGVSQSYVDAADAVLAAAIAGKQAALGYTPVNKAGDSMTGALSNSVGYSGGYFTGGLSAVNYGGAAFKVGAAGTIEFAPTSVDGTTDAKIVRNATGQIDVRGDSGLRVRNLANSGDADITANKVTASNEMRATISMNAESRFRLGVSGALQWSTSTTMASTTTDDAGIVRNAAGQLDVRADNGLRVRNLANSADAALTAGASTFSGSITVGGVAGNTVTISSGATSGTAIGSSSANTFGVAIGASCSASTNSVAIGRQAVCSMNDTIAFGYNVTNNRANSVVFGNTFFDYFFNGLTGSSAGNASLQPREMTGTNTPAGSLVLRGGLSTGNAAPGTVIIQTGVTGASGSASQSRFTNATFDASGVTLNGSTSLAGAFNLAPITKASLLASTPNAATGGRWRVIDSTPANREAYPDGTNWRWASDDTVVT